MMLGFDFFHLHFQLQFPPLELSPFQSHLGFDFDIEFLHPFLALLLCWRCFLNILSLLAACCCFILHCLSNWVVRWVFVVSLVVIHCLSCVAFLCIYFWLSSFAYMCKPMIVKTCFVLSRFFQNFFNKVCLVRHKLVSALQLFGYFFPLEGERSADRGPLVCWVDLNLQLFCSQVFA